MVDSMGFGEWMKKTRQAAGLSQVQLADRITSLGVPVTNSYLSMVEREYNRNKKGHPTRVDEDIVDAVAKVLGVDQSEARLAAGYAPATRPHNLNGFRVDLPDDIEFVLPYSPHVQSQDDADKFRDAIIVAYTVTKERIARERAKEGGT